jgi:hypothetical protein
MRRKTLIAHAYRVQGEKGLPRVEPAATNGGFPATNGLSRSSVHPYDNKNNRPL